LDEPTNHLDLGMRTAIELALQSYEGALILISHDRHLLKTSVDDFYLVYQQKVQAFAGDLDDYYLWLQSKDSRKESTSTSTANNDYKEKKTAQNRLKKLEQLMDEYQKQILKLDDDLSDSALYEDSSKKVKLDKLLAERSSTHSKLQQTEDEWLDLGTSLEL
jgi:ATP-binding cassette subfamily F protein 3